MFFTPQIRSAAKSNSALAFSYTNLCLSNLLFWKAQPLERQRSGYTGARSGGEASRELEMSMSFRAIRSPWRPAQGDWPRHSPY